MNAISLGHALLVAIGLWAIAGAARHWNEVDAAARGARTATHTGLHPRTRPGSATAPAATGAPHVLAELAVNVLAGAAFLAAGAGYALIAEPAAAVRSRRAARRPAAPRPAPAPARPALTVEPANVVDGEVLSDTENIDPAAGANQPGPGVQSGDGIEDAEIVDDPDSPTPTNTDTKDTPMQDIDTVAVGNAPNFAVTPGASTTLGQAKRDLAQATEAGATVAGWTNGQITVAGVRHETGNARAVQVAALAEQAANAAAWARASAEAAAGQGVDHASVQALAAAAAQFAAVSQSATSAAAQAAQIAADEANLAETFDHITTQMQDAAALAENARVTLAAQQDVHAAAFAQTNHTGAEGSYLADAG